MFELIWNQIIRFYPVSLVPKLGLFTAPLKRGWVRLRGKNNRKGKDAPGHLKDGDDEDPEARARQRWVLGIRRVQTQVR